MYSNNQSDLNSKDSNGKVSKISKSSTIKKVPHQKPGYWSTHEKLALAELLAEHWNHSWDKIHGFHIAKGGTRTKNSLKSAWNKYKPEIKKHMNLTRDKLSNTLMD